MAFSWNQSLSVGFAQIDTQHRQLFAHVNKLLEATSQGKGRDEIGRVIEFLAQYVVSHFGSEEQRMARSRYPGLAAHRSEHQAFLREFTSLKKQFEVEGASTAVVLLIQRQVCDWLIKHVSKTDKQLGAFLKTDATPR